LIVASAPTGDGIVPVPVDTSSIPNDHWGYAIQWFLLAATWAGMTVFLLWRIRSRTV
jgi:surfeit locus 1 family protein